MNILVIGDIVGAPGMEALRRNISKLKQEFNIDFTIANGENSADGMGITLKILNDMYALGVDVVTLGNHTWGKKEIFSFIDDEDRLIRPANYTKGICGKGYTILPCKNMKIGVMNLIGRVDTGGSYDSPFEVADEEITKMKKEGADIIVIDFHAEATAEKKALAYYLKDKVTILFGTHTHVQTNDDTIYETGMGYITDVGMTGPKDSIIGMAPEAALKRFLTQIPERYACASGEPMLNAVVFEFDEKAKKVTRIDKISI